MGIQGQPFILEAIFLSLKKGFSVYLCLCLRSCVDAPFVCRYRQRPEEGVRSLELPLYVVHDGTKLSSSGKAASALNN